MPMQKKNLHTNTCEWRKWSIPNILSMVFEIILDYIQYSRRVTCSWDFCFVLVPNCMHALGPDQQLIMQTLCNNYHIETHWPCVLIECIEEIVNKTKIKIYVRSVAKREIKWFTPFVVGICPVHVTNWFSH